MQKLIAVNFDIGEEIFVDTEKNIRGRIIQIAIHGARVEQNEYQAQWWINGEPKEHWFKAWQISQCP